MIADLLKSLKGARRGRDVLVRYGLAVCLVGLALALALAVTPVASEEHPFVMFYVVVVVSTLLGGLGPGLLATVLATVANYYAFLHPYAPSAPARSEEILHAGMFLAEGAAVCLLVTGILGAKKRAQQTEEIARRSEEHYRALVQNASDTIVLVDRDANILYESRSVEWMLGHKPEERIGRNVFDLIHPEDARRLRPDFGRRDERDPVEFRVHASDGSLRHLEAVAEDLLDDPEVGGIVVNVRDVTERRRAEERLREAETRYRAMVERMPAITYTKAVDGDFSTTFVSPQVEAVLGYSPQECLSEPRFCRRIVHPEDRERVLSEDERADETGDPFASEYRVFARDGRLVWLRDEAILVRDEDGRPLFWQGFMLDVTEQKLAQAQREESEERFRTLMDTAPVLVWMAGTDAACHYFNKPWLEFRGRTIEEEAGSGWTDDGVHPDDHGRCVGTYLKAFGAREEFEVEYRLLRRDGEYRWVLNKGVPRFAPGGEFAGYIGSCVDITERKRFEGELRESEERSRALLENSLDFVALYDPDNRIRYVSPSVKDVLGYEPEELEGAFVPSLVHPEDLEVAARVAERIFVEPTVRAQPIRYRRKDGSHVHLEGVFSNKVSHPGVGGVVCNMRDVTERIKSEEERRRNMDLILTLQETGQVLGATLDSEEICSRLVEAAQRVARPAAAVLEVGDEDEESGLRCSKGSEELLDWVRTTPGAEAARNEAVGEGDSRLFRIWHPGYKTEQLTGLCVPVKSHDRVVGVLEAYGSSLLADGRISAILDSLANQAATALENARLYAELGERERQLQDLLARLLRAQEEERRRVAYEVHDGLAQVAAAAHQHLQAYARRNAPESAEVRADLDIVVKLVRRTVTDARSIIANLRPTVLDDFGLPAALSLEVEKLREEGYEVEYSQDVGDERLPETCEITLFRIAQEAIANLRKHARTRKARVDLRKRDDDACLEITDWGAGFDPAAVSAGSGPGERVGMAGMKERAGILGGTFDVRSRPQEGTSVVATIPLRS